MSGAILSKLEIDVMQVGELREAAELAMKYNLPAIVVHPNLASDAHLARGKVQGRFKLIIPVDWPKGENFGNLKMRGLSVDAIEADGFEFMLSPGKTAGDTKNEALALTNFIKTHLDANTEVRFVLGTQNRDLDNIKELCMGLLHIPTPAMVRTDIGLKIQVNKANAEVHNAAAELIRSIVRVPIKLSGNFTNIRSTTACPIAVRFAVNLMQAKTIIKEFNQQPEDQLQELLSNKLPDSNLALAPDAV